MNECIRRAIGSAPRQNTVNQVFLSLAAQAPRLETATVVVALTPRDMAACSSASGVVYRILTRPCWPFRNSMTAGRYVTTTRPRHFDVQILDQQQRSMLETAFRQLSSLARSLFVITHARAHLGNSLPRKDLAVSSRFRFTH